MQSTIDFSTAVCESGGIKRAASPLFPCLSSSAEHYQPLPQHEFPCPTDQVCYCKRLRTSDSIPSLKTQNTHATSRRAPPSIVWHDFRNQEANIAKEARSLNYDALNPRGQMSNTIARAAIPFASMQHSKPGIEPHESLHNFFTKASINTPRGVVDFERVQVDERSPFNLVPWSIATNLNLMLYSGKTLAITIAGHLIQTNHYSQFTIRVAGHNTTINTVVVSGLQTILLGREWIRSVHLLSDFGSQNYYIPIPLAVEAAEEKFPNIVDTEAEAKNVKPVDVATSDEMAKEHDVDEFRKADCGNDHSDGQSSGGDGSSFDGQNLLDGGTPSNKPSSGDEILSDDRTSSEGTISSKDEVTPIDGDDEDDEDDSEDDSEDDKSDNRDCDRGYNQDDDGDDDEDDDGDSSQDDKDPQDEDEDDDGDSSQDDKDHQDEDEDEDEDEDYEDYKGHEGKVCDEYEGCEECDGYDECEGCKDCNEYNECKGCEEYEGYREYEEFAEGEEDPDDNLQDFMEQHTHLERFADAEQTKEAHRRQSESKGEIALPSSYYIVSQEQSAMLDPTKSQVDGVQARITKRQSKEISNILNHISRTPVGRSFKAPVEQLWPECAGAYAAKIPTPIDLGTIQMKVKNNIYPSVDDFRTDIVLLYQNSVDFNGIDHIITSTALEVRDTILNALNDMEKGKGKGSMMLRASARVTGV